jgi:hypothetical protein
VSVVAALWGRKNPIPRSWRIPAWCAVIAVATAAAAVLATVSIADWNPTVLVRMAEEQELAPLARDTDPDFVFVHYHGRGDGVSYYAIARDPLARGEEHDLFTWPAYRYGHPGYSWLAWAFSLGDAALVPYAFLLLNLLGMGVAGAAASLVARELATRPGPGSRSPSTRASSTRRRSTRASPWRQLSSSSCSFSGFAGAGGSHFPSSPCSAS